MNVENQYCEYYSLIINLHIFLKRTLYLSKTCLDSRLEGAKQLMNLLMNSSLFLFRSTQVFSFRSYCRIDIPHFYRSCDTTKLYAKTLRAA